MQIFPRSFAPRTSAARLLLATATVTALLAIASSAAAQQSLGPFNAEQRRAPENPAQVERGNRVYVVSCQSCHGGDLRGGDGGGPNLLRNERVMLDMHGERLLPIHGAAQGPGVPKIDLGKDDAEAVAAYLRSVAALIGSQGRPPAEPSGLKPLSVLAGDASAGKAYFGAHCVTCHSATGDMKAAAAAYADPKALQNRWVGGGGARFAASAATRVTATVKPAAGKSISGTVLTMDDFLITLRLDDGTQVSFRRNGSLPVVEVHDPLQAHRGLLPTYTDKDIHDVTAYLVTLK